MLGKDKNKMTNVQKKKKHGKKHWLPRLLHNISTMSRSNTNLLRTDITEHTPLPPGNDWLHGIQTALGKETGTAHDAVAAKLLDYGILSISISKNTTEHKYVVAELTSGDRQPTLIQQSAESCYCSEPLSPKPKSKRKSMLEHVFRARPRQLLGLSLFTELCVDEKSIGQLEKVADTQYPPAGLGLSYKKKLRRWLTDIKAFLSPTQPSFSMSMPPKNSPESTAEDTAFTKDVLTCEAWTEQLLVELKSKGGRAQAMKSLLENCYVSQTDIFKKTTGSQHEYLVVEVSTPNEVTRTLCFESSCYRGIQQFFLSAWHGISRATSVSGTPAVDCVWSEPMHQRYGIIVRSVRYRGNQGPSLLDLVAAFGTISNHAPTYAIATCHHCMWLADSLSSLLENSSEHDVRLSSDVQGRWRCVQMHRRNEKDVQDMVGEMIRRKGIMMANDTVAGGETEGGMTSGKGKGREFVEEARSELEAVETEERHDTIRLEKELSSRFEVLEAEIRHLKAEVKDLKTKNEELEAAVKDLKTKNEELKAAVKDLKTKNEELKVEVRDLRTKNEDLEAEVRDLRSGSTYYHARPSISCFWAHGTAVREHNCGG